MESSRLPCCKSIAEVEQIQRRLLHQQYPCSNLRLETTDWGTRQNKFWIHADNARPHTAKVSSDYIARNEMKMAPHPSDSPDLAPSDFSFSAM
jgi:hypothetical protein